MTYHDLLGLPSSDPQRLYIHVYNMRADLVRLVPVGPGTWRCEYALLRERVLAPRVQRWLAQAALKAGGGINVSGLYPCPPMPRWLRRHLGIEGTR